MRLTLNWASLQLNIQAKPVDQVVDGGEQKQQLINVECISDFVESPILAVQFVWVLLPVSPSRVSCFFTRISFWLPFYFFRSSLVGMWRSSNSNAVEFCIILPHSTFVECWNCLVIECEFDSVDVRSTDLSHCEFVRDLNVNNFHFEHGSQLHCV